MSRITLTAFLVSSVLAGGCGAEPSAEAEELLGEMSQEVESVPPRCTTTRDFIVRYYSSASKTTTVGNDTCTCGGMYSNGLRTSHYTLHYYPACVL